MEISSQVTYDLSLLEQSRAAWDRSDGLRFLYGHLYNEVKRRAPSGTVLEIGAGIGVGKAYFENLITSDVVKTHYVDRAMSAYDIAPPAGGERWGTIFVIDAFAYPLTGGYSRPQMVPTGCLRMLVKMERLLPQWFYRICGLRVIIVLEKYSDSVGL